MSKRIREEEEDGEITNTQILDELSVLKEEVEFLREEKDVLSRQYAAAAHDRDKYYARLSRRKEGSKKWKADLEDETPESLRTDYAELKYELEAKKDKWKSERNKWADRVERLEVKIEALKEENHKLVVMETRLRSDFERRILSSTSENRYKDQIKQLEDLLKHSEVAFRAADALQKEQEAATESMKAKMQHVDDIMRLKDDKIAALQMAASRAAQQLADASNALDHAAHQKSTLEKNLTLANTKFHEQIKVDAQKITSLTNDLADKNRMLAEQKNATIHTVAKLQMLENAEQSLRDEIARLTEINNNLAFADEQVRLLQADNASLSQQLSFRSTGAPTEVLMGTIDNLKMQIFNLNNEIGRMRAFAQEYELERSQLLDEVQVLRHGKGLGPRNSMPRGTFANMQLRLAQLGSALGIAGPPGVLPPGAVGPPGIVGLPGVVPPIPVGGINSTQNGLPHHNNANNREAASPSETSSLSSTSPPPPPTSSSSSSPSSSTPLSSTTSPPPSSSPSSTTPASPVSPPQTSTNIVPLIPTLAENTNDNTKQQDTNTDGPG